MAYHCTWRRLPAVSPLTFYSLRGRLLDVEVKDLTGRCRERRPPLDPGQAGLPPLQCHRLAGIRAGAEGAKERLDQQPLVEWAEARVNQQLQQRLPAGALRFDQL